MSCRPKVRAIDKLRYPDERKRNMSQASITGESMPAPKREGSYVYGTVVEEANASGKYWIK